MSKTLRFPRSHALYNLVKVFDRGGTAYADMTTREGRKRTSLKEPFSTERKPYLLKRAQELYDTIPDYGKNDFRAWLVMYKKEKWGDLAATSVKTYTMIDKLLSKVSDPLNIQSFILALDIENTTKNQYGAYANTVWGYAYKTGRTEYPRKPFFILNARHESSEEFPYERIELLEHKFRDLAYLLYHTGMRFSETKTAKVEGKVLKIIGKGSRVRSMPLSIIREAVPYFHALGSDITHNAFWRAVRKVEDKKGGSHRLRKSFINNMLRKGVQPHYLAQVVGHTPNVMFQHYMKVFKTEDIERHFLSLDTNPSH